MERSTYFDFLKETSSMVSSFLQEFLDTIKHEDDFIYRNSLLFIEKRLEKSLQKPTLFRVVYNMCNGDDFESILPIAVAFELINISSYQSNASFDNKIGALSKEEKDSQFICSMLSREYTTKLVTESDINEGTKIEILKSISKINYNIYLAQNLDLNILSKSNYEAYISNENKFFGDYHNRCYLGSGFFNGQICYWAAVLAGKRQWSNELKKFGDLFGTGLHYLNDFSDYIPNTRNELINRDYQDQLSDFRNGRLTLPLYLALKHSEVIDKLNIEDSFLSINKLDLETISDLILNDVIYIKNKKYILDYYHEALKNISFIDSSYYKSMLEVIASVLKSNKFFFSVNNKKTV